MAVKWTMAVELFIEADEMVLFMSTAKWFFAASLTRPWQSSDDAIMTACVWVWEPCSTRTRFDLEDGAGNLRRATYSDVSGGWSLFRRISNRRIPNKFVVWVNADICGGKSIPPVFKKLDLLKATDICRFQTALFMFKFSQSQL